MLISGANLINSVVIIEPAELSGYFNSSFTDLRISDPAVSNILFTTLAGISSIRSAASPAYSSSSTSLKLLSENPCIRSSFSSGSIFTNVFAASSFGSSLNNTGICSFLSARNMPAISPGSIVIKISFTTRYFLSSRSLAIARSMIIF